MPNPMRAMLKQKKEMTPKTGFNLVGLDDYEAPGEQLFLISAHKTKPEAVRAQKRYSVKSPETKTFIYGKSGPTESLADEMNAMLEELSGGDS